MYIVTVKLPKNPNHDPRNKKTGTCPANSNNTWCTDITGEHHSYVLETYEQVQSVLNSPTHVTRVEGI